MHAVSAGDIVYLFHIVVKRTFGSGLFPNSQPASPRLLEDKLETDHARSWIEDRFVPVVMEHNVRGLDI